MKKSSLFLILLLIVSGLMTFVSAKLSVTRFDAAVRELGDIHYDEASKAGLDRAEKYWQALDKNLRCDERVSEKETFVEKKKAYANLAMKAAIISDKRKIADELSDEAILAKITEAREILDAYLSPEEQSSLGNYREFTSLEAAFAANDANGGSAPAEEEAPPMC
ncbi:MAG: hypothetical protein MSC43_01505 [Clostridiales bacterium]|nr:hypothetical protein [Clostridiales bacterium]MDD7431976.1 hypothetical protein [Clostridiales bacterium]MDY3060961.1 hypothetical protein [Eubacteriales bacterium]